MLTKKCLVIIPARKGSKRVPNKNRKLFSGKPLISWTVNAAKESRLCNEIYVSTDDKIIVEITKDLGLSVESLRPKELSLDASKTIDVVKYVLKEYESKGTCFEYIILLQVTSPLRTSEHLDEAIQMFLDKEAKSVTSVCEMEHSPLWSNTLDKDLSMDGFLSDEVKNSRSQDLPSYYRLNGAIYIVRTDTLLSENSFIAKNQSYAYVMDNEDSVDIDTPLDFDIAQMIMNKRILDES